MASFKKHSVGCRCCVCNSKCPFQFQLTLSGVVNRNPAQCIHCADWNGDWILNYGEGQHDPITESEQCGITHHWCKWFIINPVACTDLITAFHFALYAFDLGNDQWELAVEINPTGGAFDFHAVVEGPCKIIDHTFTFADICEADNQCDFSSATLRLRAL